MREPMSDFAYSAVKSSGVSDTNNLILVGESDEQPPEFEPVLQPFDSQNLGDINNNDIHKHQPPPQQQHPSIMQIAADATPSSSPDNNIRMPQDSQILENVPPDKLLRFETHFSIPQAAQQSHSPPSTQQQQQQVQLQPPPQLQPQLHPNNKHQQQNQQVPQQAMQLPSPRQQQVHNQLYHPQPLQQPQIIAAQQLLQQHQQPQHQLKLQQQQQQQQQQQLHLPQAHLLGSNLSLVKKMGPPPPSPSYINSEDEYYSDASPDHDHDDNFGHGHHQSSFSKNKEVKKRKRFTKDEDDKITEGVNMYGTQSWDKIVSWSGLDRTKEQIANRYRRLAKHHPEWQHGHPHQPGTHYPHNGQFTGAPHHNHANASHNNNNNNSFYNAPNYNYAHISHHNNNNPYNNLIVPTYSNSSSSSSSSMIAGVDGDVQSKPASLVSPMGIMGEEGIPRKESQSPIPPKVPSMPQVAINGGGPHTLTPQNQNQLQPQYRAPQLHELEKKEKELRDKELRLKKWEADLISAEGRLKQYEDQLRQLKLAQDSIAEAQKQNVRDMENKFKDILIEFLLRDAENERREDRRKLSANIIRLGHVTHSRKGMDLYEIWKDGEAFEDLKARQEAINQERERIEKAKKQLQKMKHTARPTSPADGHHARDLNNNNINGGYLSNDDEGSNAVLEQEEIYKLRLQALKKEEAYLLAEREKLEIEKSLHIKEIKRIREEDRSRFNNYQILNNGRYFLMKLLGKGGFSEVYKAYDLKEYRVVACKLHQLNAQWNDERKQNYIKHARREYEIHKRLDHPRVVRFYDVFEIDVNTFSTVLEYCEGPDLDLYLKKHKFLSEREARSIIVQVFAGLKYLNEQKQKIIHYDLKPANILFTADGHIKITDFGLSKILDEDSPDAVELTSQGAGTYWYLPPECFEVGKTPKISSKVDVWSAGVVFYQILYGRKPFGNDLSQNRILSEGTIINARQVEFPPKPVLSQEAKDFIRRCLAYNQEDRPDVLTIVNDPYLANGPPKK